MVAPSQHSPATPPTRINTRRDSSRKNTTTGCWSHNNDFGAFLACHEEAVVFESYDVIIIPGL